ncbi:CoA transferase [Phytohabitans sp. ZYX-F-186]|uniref:CoA transferase n=1 Tax=Phytohabitans maris TaxID=3071409 RepID=A0ABU0ZSZ9_9ACTN|nr:CoA transferase [Phytohabitans sp. ZYX-F-186]MDQ7910144.1 CoA transferase [Phytohabitans sp. ZYX-F-186]
MSGVFAGIRVVDFGHHVAGPLAALLLADNGADVVHVDRPGALDPPGGGAGDQWPDAYLNRGKRRITLDLRDPADRDVARRLAGRADVVIENFRPGVLDRYGLGWTDLDRPALVYCSLPGFPADDPRAGVAGWEGVVAAATGNCRVRSGQAPPGWDPSRPTYSAIPMASNFAAFAAAYAIVAALVGRHRTGLGERIEVPLYSAMFEAIGGAGAYPVARGLTTERPLAGNGSGGYRCADGRYVQFNPIGASTRFLRWFLDAAGAGGWAADGLTDRARMDREPHLARLLRDRLAALFLTRPAQAWEDLAASAGVPLVRTRTTVEWLTDPHARESGQVVQLADPVLGPLWMPGAAVGVEGVPAALSPRHLPDADRAAVLRSLVDGVEEPAGTGAAELPFAGTRVVDLTQILAGPTAGRLLGELGADVTKINSPQRKVGAHGFVNRGKRTVLLDVESPRGQDVLWRLLDGADVLLQNFPRRTAERYGLSWAHVRARRPDLVYVSVSCYGYGGAWESRRGYETQAQAASGIMCRAGGDGPPRVLGPYNLLDYGTGVLAAFAAALGLYRRATTGAGAHAHTSLTQAATHHQGVHLVGADRRPATEPSGPYALGTGPAHRFHRAADGWLFVAAPGDPPDLDFGSAPAAEWVAKLRAAGIAAHEVVGLAELMADPAVRARGLAVTQRSEEAGEVVMPGIAIGLTRTPARLGAPVRRPGADGPAVLAAGGYGDRDIEDLARGWVLQTAGLPSGWDDF